MDDDNDRRRGRRRGTMTDDDRALLGLESRRVPVRYSGTAPHGIPVEVGPREDEITAPEMILGREITDLEIELLAKIGIDASTVVTMGDLAKVLLRDLRRDKEHQSGSKELGKQLDDLRKLLDTPPNAMTAELAADVQVLKDDNRVLREDSAKFRSSVRWARGIAATAIVAALGSLGAGAEKIYGLGEQEGETMIRIGHLERDLDQMRLDLREDRSRMSHQFQLQPPKGTP